jgi:hypothetical protein
VILLVHNTLGPVKRISPLKDKEPHEAIKEKLGDKGMLIYKQVFD